MAGEVQASDKSQHGILVDLPPSKFVVGCKWVYKIIIKANGTMDRYKAQLVAKGFAQEYNIDYEETFALVVQHNKCRSLFQMNVKNIFLNGDLTEKDYRVPPPRYTHSSNKVCQLCRALYDLKQALGA